MIKYIHRTRVKRGRTRYYATSALRKKIKRGMKHRGLSKTAARKATRSGWW